jgi:hypothetical protein
MKSSHAHDIVRTLVASLVRRPKRSILDHHQLDADFGLEPLDMMLLGTRLSELGERYGEPESAFPFHALDPEISVGELATIFDMWAGMDRTLVESRADADEEDEMEEAPPSTERMPPAERPSVY